MIKKMFSLFILAATLLTPCLEAVWVSPPATLSFDPAVQINGMQNNLGNAIIFWLDPDTNFYVATKYQVATQSWSTPQPVVDSTGILNVPSGAINAAGQALSVWIAGDTLNYAVETTSGWVNQGVFYTAPVGSALTTPLLANDDAGNALLILTQESGGQQTVITATYNGTSWTTQPIEVLPVGTNIVIYNVGLNNAGQGFVAWSAIDGVSNQTVKVATYLASSETFGTTTTIFSAAAGGSTDMRSAISEAGQIIVVWNINPNGLYAAIYNDGWLPVETIVSAVDGASATGGYPDINSSSQAIVVYAYSVPTSSILAASYDGSTWSSQTVVSSTTETLFNALGSIDSLGDGFAAWTSTTDPITFSNSALQVSYRTGINGTWTAPSVFAVGTATAPVLPLMIQFNEMNNAIFAWGALNPMTGGIYNLNISFGYDLFVPLSPSNFSGVQVKTKFATQTDIINRLTWTPSPNSAVTGYVIFRNGKLITQVPLPAQGPYVYEDHNRQKGVAYTYQLWSVIGNTLQSIAQTTVVP